MDEVWVWERPATIHLILTAALGAMHPLKKNHGACYADYLYGFFHKDMVRFVCSKEQLVENGKKVVLDFIDDVKGDEKRNMWTEDSDALLRQVEEIEKLSLEELDDRELLTLYDSYDTILKRWWGNVQVAELISNGTEALLKGTIPKSTLSVLTTPEQMSYATVEQERFQDIVRLAKNTGLNDEVKRRLRQHTKEYSWLHNNFHNTKTLDEDYFTTLLKEAIAHDNLKEEYTEEKRLDLLRKKQLLLEDLDDDARKLVALLTEFATLQDERKVLAMRSSAPLDGLCKEVARRKKVSYDLLKWALPDQIRAILSGEEVPVAKLEAQSERCVLVYNDKNDTCQVLRGKEALKKEDEILGDHMSKGSNELSGTIASPGRVTGVARIVVHAKHVSSVEEGDVLVSTMTSPDFTQAMKRASAIVTDEGGLTSHAAIVSRELHKPCIIGTKHATRIFKDGDLIEVDADNGVVRKV